MADVWTISGQSLAARRATSVRLNYEAMAVSTMTWRVWLADESEINTYVPDLRSVRTLAKNGSTMFTGWVVDRTPVLSAGRLAYDITVADAWFFLEQAMLSANVADGTGATSERPVFLCPVGDVADHLQAVVERAISKGMPVASGGMADGFTVPRLTLQNMTFAQALSDLMGWIADGVLWLDHSSGTAAVRMARRGTMGVISLAYGEAVIDSVSIKPRIDLEVDQVKVVGARRVSTATRRTTEFETYSHGTDTGFTKRAGLVAVTGPEINVALPQDPTDRVAVVVEDFTPAAALAHAHPLLKQAGAPFPQIFTIQQSVSAVGNTLYYPLEPLLVITDPDGNAINLADWPKFLTTGEPRDWWDKDGIEYVRARVTATVVGTSTVPYGEDNTAEPKWVSLVGARKRVGLTEVGGELHYFNAWEATLSAEVWAVRGISTGTLIRTEDWGWFRLPSDLAENLKNSQDWLPYQGTVTTYQETMAHGNPVGSKLRITGWVPEAATWDALITGATIIPRTGQVTYRCGPPLRHSFMDLANRFRGQPTDNYYWLNDPSDYGDGGNSGVGGTETGGGVLPPPVIGEPTAILAESGQELITEDGTTIKDET